MLRSGFYLGCTPQQTGVAERFVGVIVRLGCFLGNLLEARIVEQNAIDRALIADDEQLALVIDAERSGFFGAIPDLPDFTELAIGLSERPESIRFEVAEDRRADERKAWLRGLRRCAVCVS